MKSFRVQLTSVVLPEQVNREDLESILRSMGGPIENKLDDLKWKFEGTSIDFSSLENIKDNFPFINEKTLINPVWLAKILFLSSTHGLKSTTIYRAKFDSIAKTLIYLAERNIQYLGIKDLEDYISYLLMHNIDKGRLTKRLTPLNFTTYAYGIDGGTWLKTLKKYRLPLIGFSSNIIDSIGSKSLKNAIETLSAGDLTYRDWKEGGSFNHLTLDYGRYYVEHCDAYFHRNIGVAIALKATLSQAADIASQACRNVNRKNLKSFLTPIIVHFLAGKQISELKPNYRGKLKAVWLVELQKLTLISFEKNLRPLRVLDELLSDKETGLLWNQISNESININQREWLKTLIEIWWTLHVNSSSKHSELRRLEFACLVNVIGGNFDLDHINNCIDKSYTRLFSEVDVTPLTPSFFESAGIVENGTISTNVYNLIRYVEDAGIVLFVALTGWRESEFGFSLSNIKIRPNLDLLDQYACPVRYEVQWKVPKTNGNTNVHR